jgi:protein-S-isoprenylcysteine O-methyltransferase Ste14
VPSSSVQSPSRSLWAWAGGTLFVVSLGYFLFTYVLTFGEPVIGPVDPADALWNAALFTVFAFHHSLFARTFVRTFVARLVPTGLERSLYVAVASVFFILTCAWWRPLAGIAWDVPYPAAWLIHTFQAGGIGLILWSAALVGIGDLSGLRPAGVPGVPVAFETRGPYGWVRHPIYTGWCLLVFSVPLMTMTRLEFAVVSVAYILLAIPFEERTLRTGGRAYSAYAAAVKWRLVPGVY